MQERIQEWLAHTDIATRQIIAEMQQNAPQELQEAFFQDLEFGTGGLRGIMGIGTNRMNKYTVGLATQGTCQLFEKNLYRTYQSCYFL
ncbi:MAG: hypothetical protein KatS3mg028_1179 [Bacteroidia bacterium]|nr:MAG: hypothetical protein KatS3mg028_1179 [Bacteroidia bacterium]